MQLVGTLRRLPNIELVRSDVQAATKYHVLVMEVSSVEILYKPPDLIELVCEFIGTEHRAVRNIYVDDPQARYVTGDEPLWRCVVVLR